MDEDGFELSSPLTENTKNPNSCSESKINVNRCSDESKRETEQIIRAGQVCEFSAVYTDRSNSSAASHNFATEAENIEQMNNHVANKRSESLDAEEALGSNVVDQINRQAGNNLLSDVSATDVFAN